jgi:hypothetical protein
MGQDVIEGAGERIGAVGGGIEDQLLQGSDDGIAGDAGLALVLARLPHGAGGVLGSGDDFG